MGIFLALLAAKNGAKYVAVFTDSNHHLHPASACFDAFNLRASWPVAFTVERASIMLINDPNFVQDDESVPAKEVWKERLDGEKYLSKVYPRIKRWDIALKYLLNPPRSPEPEVG